MIAAGAGSHSPLPGVPIRSRSAKLARAGFSPRSHGATLSRIMAWITKNLPIVKNGVMTQFEFIEAV